MSGEQPAASGTIGEGETSAAKAAFKTKAGIAALKCVRHPRRHRSHLDWGTHWGTNREQA
jgi:hypothetical protein